MLIVLSLMQSHCENSLGLLE